MNYSKWFGKHTASLSGKTVAVSGATGGIGRELCRHLLSLGASLILLDRNSARSHALADDLRRLYEDARISHITVDLADFPSVKHAVEALAEVGLECDLVVDGGEAKLGRASSVWKVEDGKIEVLREGPVKC